MAVHQASIHHLPLPSDDQAAAQLTVGEYLNQARTHVASYQPGCPPINGDTAILVEFSTSMLRGAAPCKGMLGLTDAQDRQ